MQKLKLKILGLFKSKKINIFLLFFVLAFSILVLTKLSKVYTATLAFKVKPKDISDTHVIINSNNPELDITIQTTGFNWLRYAIKRPELDINFKTDISKKDSTLIWSVSKGFSNINKQFDKEEKIISINPDTLLFRFDVNDVKYVPIILDSKIQYAKGYNTLDTLKTVPDSVKLIGPSSVLKTISKVKTQYLELKEVKSDVNKTFLLQLDSLNKNIKTNIKQAKLMVNVSKFSEGVLDIPIQIINIPEGVKVNYFPKQVSLSFTTSLEKFNTIKSEDFNIVCDYNDASGNTTLAPKLIKQPNNVKNIRLLQQKIEFIITE
ncbi:YbbR-like domain-containing protein [Olleya sp. UBA1516]|uniref:YbbR-like domain-containing protein n=1 Tax=Olleya sp. UBA1516 TaxID=1947013 RepID=UPI0025D34AFF|nr:YbbR-like domain-containing protein [Olleya sp. UBA1516]|tara:strand:+ start:60644 stop:61603 length:960 start_codon:yes stop_codon:yes gene_type:complete